MQPDKYSAIWSLERAKAQTAASYPNQLTVTSEPLRNDCSHAILVWSIFDRKQRSSDVERKKRFLVFRHLFLILATAFDSSSHTVLRRSCNGSDAALAPLLKAVGERSSMFPFYIVFVFCPHPIRGFAGGIRKFCSLAMTSSVVNIFTNLVINNRSSLASHL